MYVLLGIDQGCVGLEYVAGCFIIPDSSVRFIKFVCHMPSSICYLALNVFYNGSFLELHVNLTIAFFDLLLFLGL
jgi:hypothetical protein